ncbi:hypothetical protein Q5P01_000254 [Channa striata]|uniref:Uncharacterized protein n=1 Tax=Channa striata TaxID=64152 RepID=A0AA88IXZ6_CHASR|nr:hypothetical protein Q5P01_000254 [Channa striata]
MNTDPSLPDFTAALESLLEARSPMAVIRRALGPILLASKHATTSFRRPAGLLSDGRSYTPSSRHGLGQPEHFAEQAPPKALALDLRPLAHDHGINVDLDRCLHAGRPGGVRSSNLHPTFFADLQHAPGGYPGGALPRRSRVPLPAPREGRVLRRSAIITPGLIIAGLSPANARRLVLRTRPGHSEAPAFVGGTGDGAGLAVLTVADRVVDL